MTIRKVADARKTNKLKRGSNQNLLIFEFWITVQLHGYTTNTLGALLKLQHIFLYLHFGLSCVTGDISPADSSI